MASLSKICDCELELPLFLSQLGAARYSAVKYRAVLGDAVICGKVVW